MSADRWHICPQCLVNSRAEHARMIKDLREAYGKIPQEDWLKTSDAIPANPVMLKETLRENYEIFICSGAGIGVAGEFYISYRASCETCGFKHSFEHKKRLLVKNP